MNINSMLNNRLRNKEAMSRKNKNKVSLVETVPEVEIEREYVPEVPENLSAIDTSSRCLEWCFLPGLSYVGPEGLLQCSLIEGHEEEHRIEVAIFSPPAGKFTIIWTVGDPTQAGS